MTDHDALLRAIVENPAEDTPRLMYADWLDDHADGFASPDSARARAALIRDDVLMAQRDEYDPARLRWELIEKPLREREPWVKEVLPAAQRAVPPDAPVFRRGFPWCVRATPTELLAKPEWFLGALPAGTFSFGAPDRSAARLFESEHFARFTGLHAQFTFLRTDAVKALAESGHSKALEEMSSVFNGLDTTAVHALLRTSLFRQLVRLRFNALPAFGSNTVSAIRQARPGRLREFELSGSAVSPRHVESMLTAPALANLTRLSLAHNRLSLDGYEGLVRADLPHLRDLDLTFTAPGPEGIRLLSTSPVMSRLRRLSFNANHVNRALAAELANCHETSNLRVLHLAANAVGNSGAAAIARSPHLAGLLVLDLSQSQVGDEGIQAILDSPLADSLVLLDLGVSPASEEMKEELNARMGDRVRL